MLSVLFRLIGRLPLRVLHALGAIAGRWAYRVSDDYRGKVDRFLAQAGLDDPALLHAALAESGKAMTEIPWLWTRDSLQTTAGMQVVGWELVERAHAAGRGILFLTPHLGCFEITAQRYALSSPITVLYSAPRRRWVRQIVESARARHHLNTAPATLAGVRQLARALKRGEAVGILPDQVPGPNEGIWAEFFGRPAFTMTLPAKLQAMSDCVVILAYGERLPRSAGYRLHLIEWTADFGNDPLTQARRLNQAMERVIRLCPSQYLWGYNRYKAPAGVEPAPPDLQSQLQGRGPSAHATEPTS